MKALKAYNEEIEFLKFETETALAYQREQTLMKSAFNTSGAPGSIGMESSLASISSPRNRLGQKQLMRF